VVPSVPTLAEAGVSGVSVPGWLALFAPVGTPPAIIARLHRAVGSALAEPSTRALLVQQAVQTDGSAPQALAAQIEADFRRWSAFVREQEISPE
jgi:tripartite-type tricarboxylate transporter receptor subunit TctC